MATLVLNPTSISERGWGGGTVTAELPHPSIEATTVSPAVEGDFTLSTARLLTIAAGSRSSTGTVTVTAANNDVDRGGQVGDGLGRRVELPGEALALDVEGWRRERGTHGPDHGVGVTLGVRW